MHRASSALALFFLIALSTTIPGAACADGNGVPVCTAAGDQLGPASVSDMAGGVIIAWHDNRPTVALGGVCFAQRLDPHGVAQWTANGVQLSTTGDPGSGTGGALGHVVIESDGAGGAFVAYGGSNAPPHVQWVNAAGVPQWGADGVAVTSVAGDRDVAIARDVGGSGGVIVAWRQDAGTGGTSDVYMQKVDAVGALHWGPGGRDVTATSTTSEVLPAVFSDGAGGVFFVWKGDGLRIQRFDANSSGMWSQFQLATMANNDVAVMTSDGSGGVIVAWAGGGAYCQRVSATGLRLWRPKNGGDTLSVGGSAPTILGDGAGGATVTWQDFRSGTNFNIYAQRLDATGVTLWTPYGAEVCYFTRDQVTPVIVSDSGTDAIIAWSDSRSMPTGADIYGERVNSSGASQWIPDGSPLCTASNNQTSPTIATDGTGGAWISWQDLRNGATADIYALRVNGSGSVLAVPPAPASLAEARAWPNPFSNGVRMAFVLPSPANVRMDVVDVSGRAVREWETTPLGAGSHELAWDGRTNDRRPAGAGIYFLRVTGPGVALARAVVRLN